MSAERGRGRIFQPAGKNFLMIAYYGPTESGRWGEIRESAKTTNEKKARTILDARLREVGNHRAGIRHFQGPREQRITVGELLDSLEQDYRSRQIKGLDHALGHLKWIREFFGCTRAALVTTDRVRTYIQQRRDAGRSNATINRETELLNRAFRLAVEENRISFAPKIPALPEDNARQGFFERGELDRLLPHLPTPLDDAVRFGYFCGWRRGEILPLRWDQVDRQAREIRLATSKNGEGRTLPLDGADWQLIEKRWAARSYRTAEGWIATSAYVFHREGRPLNKTVFGKQWRRACKAADLTGRLFHDLRRTAARDMVRGGASESFAMKVTGHKTPAMFRRYNIVSTEDMRSALRLRREYVESKGAE
jgi:integrase